MDNCKKDLNSDGSNINEILEVAEEGDRYVIQLLNGEYHTFKIYKKFKSMWSDEYLCIFDNIVKRLPYEDIGAWLNNEFIDLFPEAFRAHIKQLSIPRKDDILGFGDYGDPLPLVDRVCLDNIGNSCAYWLLDKGTLKNHHLFVDGSKEKATEGLDSFYGGVRPKFILCEDPNYDNYTKANFIIRRFKNYLDHRTFLICNHPLSKLTESFIMFVVDKKVKSIYDNDGLGERKYVEHFIQTNYFNIPPLLESTRKAIADDILKSKITTDQFITNTLAYDIISELKADDEHPYCYDVCLSLPEYYLPFIDIITKAIADGIYDYEHQNIRELYSFSTKGVF